MYQLHHGADGVSNINAQQAMTDLRLDELGRLPFQSFKV
jgi:hypothetical protein